MPMNYAAQASATPTSGTTVVVSKPAGTIDGDVLVAMVSIRASSPSITPPSGWTLVGSVAGTSSGTVTGVWTRVASSEPASYTWTSSNTITDAVGLILRYTPAAPTTAPGSVDATAQGSLVSPAVAPSVSATGNNDRLICLFSTGSTVGSTPSGMTQRAAIDNGLSGAWAYDELLTAIGATGTRTWTGSGSGVGWTVALLGNQQGSRIRMMI